MSELVTVEVFGNQTEAELAKSRLESAGIQATVFADNEGGQLPGLSLSGGGFRLVVPAELLESAKEILENT